MTRYMPLAAPLVGLVIALGIVAIEVGRGDGEPEAVASATPTPSATAEAGATPAATVDPLARDIQFASDGRHWARGMQAPSTSNGPPKMAVAADGSIIVGMTVSYFEAPPGTRIRWTWAAGLRRGEVLGTD